MTDRLTGHVALVTGGGRGIGRAIAERLYRDGAELAICGTTESVLRDTANALQEEGGRAVFWQRCDAGDEAAVQQTVAAAVACFGKVDILVNNAAVTLGQFPRERIDVPFHQLDRAVWDANLHINLTAPWFFAKAVYPHMAAQHWGRIINIGSGTVYSGRGNCAAYIASKAGLVGLTRAMAFDLGRDGITCNLVSVGLTLTDRMVDAGYETMAERFVASTPMARTQRPDDVPGTVAYFASDDAGYVTGQALSVDGGRTMH